MLAQVDGSPGHHCYLAKAKKGRFGWRSCERVSNPQSGRGDVVADVRMIKIPWGNDGKPGLVQLDRRH